MKASDLFVRCLENEGVEYIFGIPGEENLDVMDSMIGSNIKFITTRHEQGAAFMADVYGRLTGKAGTKLVYAPLSGVKLATANATVKLVDHQVSATLTGLPRLKDGLSYALWLGFAEGDDHGSHDDSPGDHHEQAKE